MSLSQYNIYIYIYNNVITFHNLVEHETSIGYQSATFKIKQTST